MIIKSTTASICAFWVLIIVYSGFSSMMPKSFGFAELVVGILLVGLSVSKDTVLFFANLNSHDKRAISSLVILAFLILFFVPLITGIVRQNDIVDIIRDVVPVLFFFIPLLFYGRVKYSPEKWIAHVSNALALVGVSMAVRHFMAAGGVSDLGEKLIFGGKVSLAHDPAVLFAAIYLAGMALKSLGSGEVLIGLVYIIMSAVPVMAMLAVAARAPFALFVFALAAIGYFSVGHRLLMRIIGAVVTLIVAGVVYYFFGGVIEGAINLMLMKQEVYGVSSRDLEFMAVIDNITGPLLLLFGEGWGGLINNPIGGGASWSFVHNVFAYFLFKTGVVGVFFLGVYLWWNVRAIWVTLRVRELTHIIIVLAAVPPILVNALLEVGYKTLTFGLLLALIHMVYLSYLGQASKVPSGGRQ